MNFDYSIGYVPGENIPNADAVSRLQFRNTEIANEVHNEIGLGVHFAFESQVTWEELIFETQKDKVLQSVKKRVITDDWSACTNPESQFKKNRVYLSVENEVLVLGSRPIIPIPAILRKRLISAAHDAHPGMTTTKYHFKKTFGGLEWMEMWKTLSALARYVPRSLSPMYRVINFHGMKRKRRLNGFILTGRLFPKLENY